MAEVLAHAVTETLSVEESEAEDERVPPGAPPPGPRLLAGAPLAVGSGEAVGGEESVARGVAETVGVRD